LNIIIILIIVIIIIRITPGTQKYIFTGIFFQKPISLVTKPGPMGAGVA